MLDSSSKEECSGIMGVPISFLEKYNPEQFEIIGVANHGTDSQYDLFSPTVSGKLVYKGLLIRHRLNKI